MPAHKLDQDVRAYAALAAALANGERLREVVLAEHGLDEESWERLDDAWQERLSAAADAPGDEVPALVAAFSEAFAEAGRGGAPGADPPASLECFARATRGLGRGADPAAALAATALTLAGYLRAQAYWTPRMIAKPELAARFRELLGEG
ncbi:MAG: hypothetical protein HY744_06785 [Deltaproteobacteria bacterium]|nr:hypothetical protein [Deltaproteobacteria bacterium]